MVITQLIPFLFMAALPDTKPATQPAVEYLSDVPHRVLFIKQHWGRLGINTCGFDRINRPQPLRIGDKEYGKGIGFQAPGEICIELSGEYDQFDTEIGLQPLPDRKSNVVFQVFVDDQKRFESAEVKISDPPLPISIPVSGAMELRLVAVASEDGDFRNSCSLANARLTRTALLNPPAESLLDLAPFAQVITCDPARETGTQSKRVEEYPAEDIFLETDLTPDANGYYTVPSYSKGQCIGLKWLERRLIRELVIDFDGDGPDQSAVQVQCWIGESLWQGNWKPLGGSLEKTASGWRLLVDWSQVPDARGGTRKIRWILPPGKPVLVRGLAAITMNRLDTMDLTVQLENPVVDQPVRLEMYNGQFLDGNKVSMTKQVALDDPQRVKVRYTKPRAWKRDWTVLRVHLPKASFGIAIDDIEKDGCVYVRGTGLFFAKQGGPTLEQYKEQIEAKKTIRERVREMPDQTFAQAIERVHYPKQNLQPMLLSLACDNNKFVVYRDGVVHFGNPPALKTGQVPKFLKYPARMIPTFGSGKNTIIRRHLDGGWLPAPVTEIEDEGVVYTQRTFVIPSSSGSDSSNPWLNSQPVCVVDVSARPVDEAKVQSARVELTFHGDAEQKKLAEVSDLDVRYNGQVLGRVADLDPKLTVRESDGKFEIEWSAENWGSVFQIYLYGWPVKADDTAVAPVSNPFQILEHYWMRVMEPVMQAELPDPLLSDVIRASQVHCLIAARNEADAVRVSPWIASDAYGPLESESNSIIRGMDAWGHTEFARRSLDFFIDKYSPAGLLTTGYTLMGMGWHLWTLGEHYQLTKNNEWMKQVAPKVSKACGWIVGQRSKTQQSTAGAKPPEYGLMPPGILADWNVYSYYFCLNGYYYKGLLEAARALAAVGDESAGEFLTNASAYREDILRAYQWAQSRMPVYPLRDGTNVPGYPSQLTAPGPTNNFFPGEDGNRSWCYDVELGAHQLVPQGLLDPAGTGVTDMMDHMEDVQFLSTGWFGYPAEENEKDWFNFGGFAKVQPYYCRNIEIDALRDDVKPFIRSYFNTIPSLLGLETLSMQEHFNGIAAWNKTHETGYFLYYSRLMLVQERGDELWLAPFVTTNWLKDGMTISVKNAPTRFGPVSYEIESHVNQGHIKATVHWPMREKPKNIALRLRHPEGKRIQNVSVQVPDGGRAFFHMDEKTQVLHLQDTEPVAKIQINF